jgi:RNA polymerase sigma-70 factor, ECF subfamily
MKSPSAEGVSVAALFEKESRFVWGLAYRMTGSAADADDIVQETFARALRHHPSTSESLRPWLAQVAVNLGRDALRRRRRREYVGPWLPSPVDDELLGPFAPDAASLLERREGAAYAFLLALEVLTPQQRAVLVLRDVCELSVRETAAALHISDVRVKVTHHRARARLKAEQEGGDPVVAMPKADATLAALVRFVTALTTDDDSALLASMSADAFVLSDGGGEYLAALRPVLGAARVARFFTGLRRKLGTEGKFEVRSVNGGPAIVAEHGSGHGRFAPRWLLRLEVGAEGKIAAIHLVAASRKLTHVRALAAS